MGRAEETLEKVRRKRERHKERNVLYRTIFAVAAVFVVAGGIVLSLPLVPGPGVLLIAIGLSMLALEFTWAER
ncbi:MAG: TIGR02611 family protein, partial [Actinobacteria bacterium]|nr:TIGR02611 family protein [Actinomycetota bacterium]